MITTRRTTARTVRSLFVSFSAAAIAGSVLSVTGAGGALAAGEDEEEGASNFAGFATAATAAPIKLEIYESTIPVPATPQLELSLGYSEVGADSSASKARASYLWPGASVGEGFKVIVENLKLPPEIAEPIAATGYPIQVNAGFPGDTDQQADEPLPGLIQRAEAGKDVARADTGFSLDGEPAASDDGGGDGSDDDEGGDGGGLPGLPGIAGTLTSGLPGLSTARSGSNASRDGDLAASDPIVPAPLSGLIDIGGFTSTSRTENDLTTKAFAQGRSIVSDITLLGGLVTIDSVKVTANASSDGAKGVAEGATTFGDITAFGQKFAYGDNGFEAVGQTLPIPGLPDDASEALAMLGLKISVAKPTSEVTGDAAVTTMPGLVIDFDLTVLRKQIGPIVDLLNTIVNELPSETGRLKGDLQAAINLSPRIVVIIGNSTAKADTSPAIELPPVPTPSPTATPTESGGETPPPTGGDGGPVTPVDGAPPTTDLPGSDTPTTGGGDTALPTSSQTQPGLPSLFTIPGLLLYGGLIGAGVAGMFARRLGLLALGGAGSCAHGLDSGLPDLRKVT